MTTIIVVFPDESDIMLFDGQFEIEEVMVVNSAEEIQERNIFWSGRAASISHTFLVHRNALVSTHSLQDHQRTGRTQRPIRQTLAQTPSAWSVVERSHRRRAELGKLEPSRLVNRPADSTRA